jgi:hypothetical protein
MRNAARRALATAVLLSTVCIVSSASAATSEDAAHWNDHPVARAWFNSGRTPCLPGLGRNAFTLKVAEGAEQAAVYWEKTGVENSGTWRTLHGSGNEITFSVSGPVNSRVQIWYKVCGKLHGQRYCGPGQFDWIR